jgi:thioredoxin reductase (NADPH)
MAEAASEFDVAIIGAGPAGIQSGIHAVRRGMKVVLLGHPERSALVRGHIENYACVQGVVEGEQLLKVGLEQVRRFGVVVVAQDAVAITPLDSRFKVVTEEKRELKVKALILATGSARRKLGVPGEKEFEGKGVSYCADCDAGFYRKKKVVVVGNGSAAAAGASHLTHFASEVTLVADKPAFSKETLKELAAAKVKLLQGSKVKDIKGEGIVKSVTLSDGSNLAADGVFIELGAKGVLELTVELGIALDDNGNVAVDRKMATSVPGVFAAGDVTGPPLQMAKAVGEGCVAGISAAEYVKHLGNVQTDEQNK